MSSAAQLDPSRLVLFGCHPTCHCAECRGTICRGRKRSSREYAFRRRHRGAYLRYDGGNRLARWRKDSPLDDQEMVERTRQRVAAAGIYNILYRVRDVFADGFGGKGESKDACLLFNILHCEKPVKLLAKGARVVRPGGVLLTIHWHYDKATPRGPSMEI